MTLSNPSRPICRAGLCALLMMGATLGPAPALAQVPPHEPGTVCQTPRLWCWANPPGKPGTDCLCPTPYGPIAGKRA